MSWAIFAYIGLVIEVYGLHVAGRHPWGWGLAAFGASLWIVYAVMTPVWPVLASTIVFGSVYFYNWLRNKYVITSWAEFFERRKKDGQSKNS